MSIFNETGRKSRAWWLYMVKRAGNSPGINPIRKAARIDWASANDAIKDLAAGGYLEIGGNVHKHYNLTSMGHRYINEHKLELEEFRPESAIATEVTHAVPQFPEQVSRVDINSAPPIVFTKKPAKQPNMPSAPPPVGRRARKTRPTGAIARHYCYAQTQKLQSRVSACIGRYLAREVHRPSYGCRRYAAIGGRT